MRIRMTMRASARARRGITRVKCDDAGMGGAFAEEMWLLRRSGDFEGERALGDAVVTNEPRAGREY
jgi:hypothetical protein